MRFWLGKFCLKGCFQFFFVCYIIIYYIHSRFTHRRRVRTKITNKNQVKDSEENFLNGRVVGDGGEIKIWKKKERTENKNLIDNSILSCVCV